MNLRKLLAREQRAYLARDRNAWEDHLGRARAFLAEGLRQAPPDRPILILGAGTGLEVPWAIAPRHTIGWDADPWSRIGTFLRHRRFPPWVFEDFTGGFRDLAQATLRSLTLPGSLQRRPPERAAQWLAGLVPSLRPDAAPLGTWIRQHVPGCILVANVLGQLGCVAERLVEQAFLPASPWVEDPERPDPLSDALDTWTRRALESVCAALAQSGAAIWSIHDRAVVLGDTPVTLGPWTASWIDQFQGSAALELSDPLLGLDLRDFFPGREAVGDRWLWPVGPGQRHVIEALAWKGAAVQPKEAGSPPSLMSDPN